MRSALFPSNIAFGFTLLLSWLYAIRARTLRAGDASVGTNRTRLNSFSKRSTNRPQHQQHQQQQRYFDKPSILATTYTFADTTPVIGVLAQPLFGSNSSYYIAASYIKWLEGAGARTIVIPYQASEVELHDLFTQIHMVFLPGGASDYPTRTMTTLLDMVVKHNRLGYFPVWGTCLGFEFLIQYVADNDDSLLTKWEYQTSNVSLALEDVVPMELYASESIYNIATTTNTTFNNHEKGIDPSDLMKHSNLQKYFAITSINYDQAGRAFVSSIEPRRPHEMPFYGVQYHPEKNTYEYATYPNTSIPYQAIDHSPTGIEFSLALAHFVVQGLARKSLEANPSHQYTQTARYPPVYTYPVRVGTQFEQVYVISKTLLSTS